MPRRRSATLQFNAIRLVGGLLPASLLEQIARQEAAGQKASDYGLQKNQRLQVAVDQAWSRARTLWQQAQELRPQALTAQLPAGMPQCRRQLQLGPAGQWHQPAAAARQPGPGEAGLRAGGDRRHPQRRPV
jgi:hypothetical protein